MTDEKLIARLRDWDEYDEGKINDARQAAADRIEALVKERDAAYAKGFSDAEAEISATAIGQQNAALHDQLARARAEMDALAKISAEAERVAKWERDRAERLEAALRELVTCVEDGCLCSEMKMATAIDEARAALSATTEEGK